MSAKLVLVPLGPIDEVHRVVLLAALRIEDWNRARAARRLGIGRKTLYNWMRRLGLIEPRSESTSGGGRATAGLDPRERADDVTGSH